MKYDSSYWAVVAQIIPVIMLALVLEGRYFSRLLSRKSSFPANGGVRVGYAIIFIVNSIALYIAFLLALDGAGGNGMSRLERIITEGALIFGVSTVFLTPLLNVAYALVGDKIWALLRRMPWSNEQRRERRKRSARLELDMLRREFDETRLGVRKQLAQAYIAAYTAQRAHPIRGALDRALDALDELRAGSDADIARLAEKMARAEQNVEANKTPMSPERLEDFRAQLKSVAGV
ncbi:hypothetical protein [Microbacterium oxydans]|uniref:hypothetical protein n=1 Tax=Microbacterium oxydans TaxID=82380 RepID=UPI003670403B